MFAKMSNLKQRIAVGGITTLTVWLIIYFSFILPLLFLLMIIATICGALSELYSIAKAKKHQPQVALGMVASAAYAAAIFLSVGSQPLALLPEIVLIVTLASIFAYYFLRGSEPLSNIAVTLFGIAYIALPLCYILKINYFFPTGALQDGRCWLVYVLMVSKMTDTGAFFFGKNFGRRPLAPHISPKKTVEGAIGGLITSTIISVLFYLLANNSLQLWAMDISLWQSVYLGIAISLAAQYGDLAESLLKRDGGLKDSSNLPGLGGVLDVVDSMIFAVPLLYFFLKMQFAN